MRSTTERGLFLNALYSKTAQSLNIDRLRRETNTIAKRTGDNAVRMLQDGMITYGTPIVHGTPPTP